MITVTLVGPDKLQPRVEISEDTTVRDVLLRSTPYFGGTQKGMV